MRSRPWLRKPGRTSGARDLEGPLDDLSAVALEWRLRTRSRGRQDVYDIRVEPAHGSSGSLRPRWPASLYDNDGRRHLLWHVDDWQLDDPHAEVSELRGPRGGRGAGPGPGPCTARSACWSSCSSSTSGGSSKGGRLTRSRCWCACRWSVLECWAPYSGALGPVRRRLTFGGPRRYHLRIIVSSAGDGTSATASGRGTASRAQVLPWARAEGSPPLRPVPPTLPPRPLPSYA